MAMYGKGGNPGERGINPSFQEVPPDSSGPPTQRVLQMRQQGMSNNQVIQILQNEGYSPNQVFDALNQADIKGGVDFQPTGGQAFKNPMQFQQPQYPQQMQSPQEPFYDEQPMQPPMDLPNQPMPPMDPNMAPQQDFGPQQSPAVSPDVERMEEIAEAIIDEKWNDIVKSINKIIDWKERTDQKISALDEKFEDIKKDFEMLHQGVIGKVKEYDDNLNNVGTEIKAMEKVFQKVLPSLTENINDLGRITRDMKSK